MKNIRHLMELFDDKVDPNQYEGDAREPLQNAEKEIEEAAELIANIFYVSDFGRDKKARDWIEKNCPDSQHHFW